MHRQRANKQQLEFGAGSKSQSKLAHHKHLNRVEQDDAAERNAAQSNATQHIPTGMQNAHQTNQIKDHVQQTRLQKERQPKRRQKHNAAAAYSLTCAAKRGRNDADDDDGEGDGDRDDTDDPDAHDKPSAHHPHIREAQAA